MDTARMYGGRVLYSEKLSKKNERDPKKDKFFDSVEFFEWCARNDDVITELFDDGVKHGGRFKYVEIAKMAYEEKSLIYPSLNWYGSINQNRDSKNIDHVPSIYPVAI